MKRFNLLQRKRNSNNPIQRQTTLKMEPLEPRQMLTVTASAIAPTIDGADIAMLDAIGQFDPGGDEGHVWSNRPIQGQTFTTGANPTGYNLNSVTLQNEENSFGNNTGGFTVRVGTVVGNTFNFDNDFLQRRRTPQINHRCA